MTSAPALDFYVTGGTVPRDAPSYIVRQADTALLDGLRNGHFCYVLTSRQMGKSSLMVRAATQLRQEGLTCVILDLTAIGQNLDAQRWYGGLLNQLGQQVGLEDELDEFWLAPSPLGPMQRWMQALQQIVLKSGLGSLILFVDEIDAVRSLPFSADEFFAGIRECYNRRSENPEFARLTFCLLGVATPSDLIRDTRTTPFNIGRRIDLTYFTVEEASALKAGLVANTREVKQAEELLARALYWTGGHPYLTQRLCQAIAERIASPVADAERTLTDLSHPGALVDSLCEELFLSSGARERDDNLIFVRERLLRSEVDQASLLDLYGRVRQGRRVVNEESNPLVSLLRLSGIVKVSDRFLTVSNRIYAQVFDRKWAHNHMPDAERRRQKQAFRRGLALAGSLAGVIVSLMTGLTAWALHNAHIANQKTQEAHISAEAARTSDARAKQRAAEAEQSAGAAQRSEREKAQALKEAQDAQLRAVSAKNDADTQAQKARDAARREARQRQYAVRAADAANAARASATTAKTAALQSAALARRRADEADLNLYAANMSLIQRDWDSNNLGHVRELLAQTRARGRGTFEWGYWNRLCQVDLLTIKGPSSDVSSVAFSADGKRVLTGSYDNTAKVWDAATGKEQMTLKGHSGYVSSVAFSADGKRILTGSWDNTAKVWDAATGKELMTLKGHSSWLTSVAFSPDGKRILTGSWDNTAKVWDAASGLELLILKGHSSRVFSVAFSPDGKRILTGSWDKTAKVWFADGTRVPIVP